MHPRMNSWTKACMFHFLPKYDIGFLCVMKPPTNESILCICRFKYEQSGKFSDASSPKPLLVGVHQLIEVCATCVILFIFCIDSSEVE